MPKPSPDPTTKRPAANLGNGLAVGVWALLAFVNILAVAVSGAIWAIPVAIAAIVMAVLTVRQIRGRSGSAGD